MAALEDPFAWTMLFTGPRESAGVPANTAYFANTRTGETRWDRPTFRRDPTVMVALGVVTRRHAAKHRNSPTLTGKGSLREYARMALSGARSNFTRRDFEGDVPQRRAGKLQEEWGRARRQREQASRTREARRKARGAVGGAGSGGARPIAPAEARARARLDQLLQKTPKESEAAANRERGSREWREDVDTVGRKIYISLRTGEVRTEKPPGL